MKVKSYSPIFLHDIELRCEPDFEIQFENFLREKLRLEDPETAKGMAQSLVSIEKRTVYVQAHNTWCNLLESEVAVEMTNERDGVCRGNHSVPIRKYIEDPLVALVFRVEFEATLPGNIRRPSEKLVVAWDLYLPAINSQGAVATQSVDLRECRTGN